MDIYTLRLLGRWVCAEVSCFFMITLRNWQLWEVGRSSANGLKTAMFNFDLSFFELRYNEVHCHSLKLCPFFSSKIIMVSQSLDYCSRKVTHFLKYPTVTVKIIPSWLKFSSLCRENKAFNYTLIAWKIRSVYQFSANQKEWNKTNSLQGLKQAIFKGRKLISEVHHAPKMASLHAKNCRMESWEDCIILLWQTPWFLYSELKVFQKTSGNNIYI